MICLEKKRIKNALTFVRYKLHNLEEAFRTINDK